MPPRKKSRAEEQQAPQRAQAAGFAAIAGKTLAALGYASAPRATAPADATPTAKSPSACPARRGAWSSSAPPAGCVLVVQIPRASDGMLKDGMPIPYPHVLRDWLPPLWRCADCNAECSRVYVPPDDGSSAHTESIYRPLISAFAPIRVPVEGVPDWGGLASARARGGQAGRGGGPGAAAGGAPSYLGAWPWARAGGAGAGRLRLGLRPSGSCGTRRRAGWRRR